MGTILGQTLTDAAAQYVSDVNRIRWTDVEWLRWLNDAQAEAVVIKPELNTVVATTKLTPGTTLQQVPTGGHLLIDIVRNMGAAGTTPGLPVTVASRQSLDAVIRDWHSQDSDPSGVQCYVYDPRVPKRYYVYPKAPATDWYVELAYSAMPSVLPNLATAITLDDVFSNALLEYMLYKAFLVDAEHAQQGNVASLHYNAFRAALGADTAADITYNPNLKTATATPELLGTAGKPIG